MCSPYIEQQKTVYNANAQVFLYLKYICLKIKNNNISKQPKTNKLQ